MDSIHKQPESTPQLAAHALKWMLAAEQPLEPLELISAIGIDPDTLLYDHVRASASVSACCLELSLDIDFLISFY